MQGLHARPRTDLGIYCLVLVQAAWTCPARDIVHAEEPANRTVVGSLDFPDTEDRPELWLSLPPHQESLLGAVVTPSGSDFRVVDRLPPGSFEASNIWQSSESIQDHIAAGPESPIANNFIKGLGALENDYRASFQVAGVELRSVVPKDEETIRRFVLSSKPIVEAAKEKTDLLFVSASYRGNVRMEFSFDDFATKDVTPVEGFTLSRPRPQYEELALSSERPVEFAYQIKKIDFTFAPSGQPTDCKLLPASPSKSNMPAWETHPRLTTAPPENFYRVNVFYATDRKFGELTPDETKSTFWMEFVSYFMTFECWVLVAIITLVLCLLAVGAFRMGLLEFTALRVLGTAFAVFLSTFLIVGSGAWAVAQRKMSQAGVHHPDDATALQGELTYGTCEVSIPKNHREGELNRPVSLFLIELEPENPTKHIAVLDRKELGEDPFFDELDKRLEVSPQHECFVFVHGYNNTFEDAARRTAQLWYDLKFPGAPIFFSWPSQGNRAGYTFDGTNADWSKKDFVTFLSKLQARATVGKIHLIAHSMGNRVVAGALSDVAALDGLKPNRCKISEIVLAAPDIDANTFKRDIAPRFLGQKPRVTLYASGKDDALKFSWDVNGFHRAGDASRGIVILKGMDSVDASLLDTTLDNHGYFAAHRSVVADIDYVLKGLKPEERHGLEEATYEMQKYWVFRP